MMHYQKNPQPATSITGMDESARGLDMQNQGLQKFTLLALDSPLVLPPGSYSMVAYGFSGADPDGNESLQTKTCTTNDGGGLISFTVSSRHGGSPGILPPDLATGSANSYAAGTFQFSASSPSNSEWAETKI